MHKLNYRHTIVAGLIGAISQAFICNFAPLLFLTFQDWFSIPLEQITLLITTNFVTQLLTDLAASKFAGRIGYRPCLIAAHILCGAGLVLMAVLPFVMPSLLGLLISVCLYAVGGGLLEVLVSPMIEACPTKNKAGIMSLLHSFYCWGVVLTILLSTAFFAVFGIENWQVLSCLLAVVPLANAVFFAFVPIYTMGEETGDKANYKQLFSQKSFYLMLVMMLCSGASEQAVSQWASAFTETGLHVSKTMGDLIGACGFAALMGLSRAVYGKYSDTIPLKSAMVVGAMLCIVSYLMIGLSPSPTVGLLGCILCGFSVGVFWPGTCSMATQKVHMGGTTMFALLALAGDMGCTTGPTIAGFAQTILGGDLGKSLLCVGVFPVLLLVCLLFLKNKKTDM